MARRKVRWGHLHEIDRRIKVGSHAWADMPRRLKHLTAWRYMHLVPGGKTAHKTVQRYAHSNGVQPSSDLRLVGRLSKIMYLHRRGALRLPPHKIPRQ